jgi:integration host factor subunit beta
MNRAALTKILSEKENIPAKEAKVIVGLVFDSMRVALANGDRIEIRGFGSFEIRHYGNYKGRNPKTGQTVDVRPKKVPFFKVGKELKERVNK